MIYLQMSARSLLYSEATTVRLNTASHTQYLYLKHSIVLVIVNWPYCSLWSVERRRRIAGRKNGEQFTKANSWSHDDRSWSAVEIANIMKNDVSAEWLQFFQTFIDSVQLVAFFQLLLHFHCQFRIREILCINKKKSWRNPSVFKYETTTLVVQ